MFPVIEKTPIKTIEQVTILNLLKLLSLKQFIQLLY